MTRESILELAKALRPRYRAANKAQKGRILDEFCATTAYHRKAAIRLLNRAPNQPTTGVRVRRGRPRQYHPGELLAALTLLWEASGYICSKRLAPFLGTLLDCLVRHDALSLDARTSQQLAALSPATIDRLLAPVRHARLLHPHVSTPNVASLAHKVATHSFADLRVLPPGHLEIDLVLHCGTSTEGFYLTTLVGVEIVSGWTEAVPVWGKGKERVGGAVERLRRRLPFPLRGLHSDNGGEFINDHLYAYCQRHAIAFSHSRPYHKNDQPRVEQRNASLVRQLIGYGRYNSRAAYAQLDQIYEMVHWHSNFFQPIRKLTASERQGARMIKRYDAARTPYQRLLDGNTLGDEARAAWRARYQELNPLQLQRQIEQAIDDLWAMEAADPGSQRAALARVAADLPPLR